MGYLAAIMSAFNKVTDAASKILDQGDPQKFATAVDQLNTSTEESFTTMRKIITESSTLSDKEKVEELKKLAEQEASTKVQYAETLGGHSERTAQIALNVVTGLLTAGLSFAPELIKRVKLSVVERNENALPASNEPPLIEAEDVTIPNAGFGGGDIVDIEPEDVEIIEDPDEEL